MNKAKKAIMMEEIETMRSISLLHKALVWMYAMAGFAIVVILVTVVFFSKVRV